MKQFGSFGLKLPPTESVSVSFVDGSRADYQHFVGAPRPSHPRLHVPTSASLH